ncbi:PilN domain-containing protein [Sodalis sp. C49]|uniref:PilN domain-containing protein n=1 Tax=Sodalis sp. C49 TaxID=3228929 RepID=UPI003965AF56
MYQVNLLPWRRQRRRRRARIMSLALAVELLLASGLLGLQARRGHEQLAELGALLSQWQQREKQIRGQRQRMERLLERRQELENKLRGRRRANAGNQRYRQLLDQLPGLLPPGLWLTRLRLCGTEVHISGCSERYAHISTADRLLSRHPRFASIRWRRIEQQENGRFSFELQAAWPAGAADDAGR